MDDIHYQKSPLLASKARVHTTDASAKDRTWVVRNLAKAIAWRSEGVRCHVSDLAHTALIRVSYESQVMVGRAAADPQ